MILNVKDNFGIMKFTKKTYQLISIFCVLFPFTCAAEKISKEENKNIPIVITSVKMRSDQKANHVTFTGNVVAKRGSLTISSDEMTVYNIQEKKAEKIVARGHVQIKSERRFASGDRAVYIKKEGKIVLTGNPRAWENDNEISGTKMIFFVDDDKFIVLGSKDKKMKLTFYPKQNKKK